MSSDLLALLPPEALDRLVEIAYDHIWDPYASDADKVDAFADAVLRDLPMEPGAREREAYLLALVIRQAREVEALRAALGKALGEVGDRSGSRSWNTRAASAGTSRNPASPPSPGGRP